MLAAVESGDAKKLAALMMRQDPGFNVNTRLNENGQSLLHCACSGGERRSPVIPLLLAHPDIDVNRKNKYGWTPFLSTCYYGSASCAREMLKDSRVMVNEPTNLGFTPLWCAASNGCLNVIKWLIASGREMDLGKPGDIDKTDAIGKAKQYEYSEVVTLLESFKDNPVKTRYQVRVKLGLVDETAAEMFARVVFVSDGLLQIKNTTTTTPAATFFNIARSLPLELQMVLCYRLVGSLKEIIQGKDSEEAFKELARRI